MNGTRPSEDAAWAGLLERWEDEGAHREYLGRLWDLEGLAEAGRRYKVALDDRPDDPVARRWRDEVIRRATALALAQLPRTRPPREVHPGLRRAIWVTGVMVTLGMLGWALLRLPHAVGP